MYTTAPAVDTSRDVSSLVDAPLERMLVASVIARPDLLDVLDPRLDLTTLGDMQARATWIGIADLRAAGRAITAESVAARIAERGYESAVDWYPRLVAATPQVIRPDVLAEQSRSIVRLADRRARAIERGDEALRAEQEIDEIALRDVDDTPPPPAPKWRRCRDLVDAIMERAGEPWVRLVLDGGTLAEVRPGGIAQLVGPTGGGKTSLAASLLVEHAQRSGPALSVSLELTGDEWVARAIGVRTGASWPAVLRGQVPAGQMIGALPERLAIVERDDASIETLEAAIDELRREYPNEPILVAVDYVQLVGADSEGEIRPRIGRVMRRLDRIARSKRVVLLALSQGSRASSRVLRSGEATGAQTTDAGAESADLERWSTVTLAIVGDAPPDDEGWCRRGIALGKSRMGAGDAEVPARYHGPSGRWVVDGEARPAADVRAEREAKRDDARIAQLALAVRGAIESASGPLSDRQLAELVRGTATARRAATRRLLDNPDTGIVRCGRASAGKHPRYPVWTRERAEAAGLPIHDCDPGDES